MSTFVLMIRCVPSFELKDLVPRAVTEEHRKCCGWTRVILQEDGHVSSVFKGKRKFSRQRRREREFFL